MKYFLLLAVFVFGMIDVSHSQDLNNESSDSIYQIVNQKPYLKGKRNKLNKELQKKLIYPDQYKLQGIEGTVITRCVISKEGTIDSAKITKSLHPDLDKQAIVAIKNLGVWIPAKVNGEYVSSYFTIPVVFKLSDDETEIVNKFSKFDFKNKPPLFVLDGKIVEKIMVIEPYDIRSIRVIKGQNAIDKYGEKAKFGVVEMISKSKSSYLN